MRAKGPSVMSGVPLLGHVHAPVVAHALPAACGGEQGGDADARRHQAQREEGVEAREVRQAEDAAAAVQTDPGQRDPRGDERHPHEPHRPLARLLRDETGVAVRVPAHAHDHPADADPVRRNRERDDEERQIAHALQALDDGGDALSPADAHRDQPVTFARTL
jgi:hypothetical protein